jgi:uncharacterized membrane protein
MYMEGRNFFETDKNLAYEFQVNVHNLFVCLCLWTCELKACLPIFFAIIVIYSQNAASLRKHPLNSVVDDTRGRICHHVFPFSPFCHIMLKYLTKLFSNVMSLRSGVIAISRL